MFTLNCFETYPLLDERVRSGATYVQFSSVVYEDFFLIMKNLFCIYNIIETHIFAHWICWYLVLSSYCVFISDCAAKTLFCDVQK